MIIFGEFFAEGVGSAEISHRDGPSIVGEDRNSDKWLKAEISGETSKFRETHELPKRFPLL